MLGARAGSTGRVRDSVQHGCPTGQLHLEIVEGETDCVAVRRSKKVQDLPVDADELIRVFEQRGLGKAPNF